MLLKIQRCKIVSMTRTQIQLPDAVYEKAKRVAETHEISMAELLRRGLELIISQYPEPDKTSANWSLPKPRNMGWHGLSDGQIKEQAQMTEFESSLTHEGKTHA